MDFSHERLLTEVNTDFSVESYPFIGKDGEKLYYTSSDGIRMVSFQRSSLSFGTPELVYPDRESVNSCFVSANELEMFVVRNQNELIKASRTHPDSLFRFDSRITLDPVPDGYLASPSFTADLSELVLYFEDRHGNAKNLLYKREGRTDPTYVMASEIKSKTPMEAGLGRLSADGLSFNVAVWDGISDVFYQFKRVARNRPFSSEPEIIPFSAGTETESRFIMPCISEDLSLMFYVINKNGAWDGNDLAVALNTKSGSYIEPKSADFEVYPNPASRHFQVSGSNEGEAYSLLDNVGKVVRSGILAADKRVDIEGVPPGQYVFQMNLPDGEKAGIQRLTIR